MVAVFMSVLRYLNAVKKNKEGNQIQMWDMEIPGEVTIREVFRTGKCGIRTTSCGIKVRNYSFRRIGIKIK